jgi:hypothetical protein
VVWIVWIDALFEVDRFQYLGMIPKLQYDLGNSTKARQKDFSGEQVKGTDDQRVQKNDANL